MQPEQSLRFGPYHLDLQSGQLWHGKQVLKITPKAVAVLCTLAQRPGQLVTKEELFQTVWAETVVSDAALTSCMRELRQALGDKVQAPQYIETVHRRGYRFIGKVVRSQQAGASNQNSKPTPSPQHPTPTLIGRDTELAQLHHWLDKALSGERQIVFVTGEPGIGKTALVDLFLTRLRNVSPIRIGRGHCLDHYGEGEAYLPILEALGRLCHEPGTANLIPLLRQYAATWLIQMPAVLAMLNEAELASLQQRTQGATRPRMLREMAEAIEAITMETPLVLLLEGRHWSDHSTLELLAYLAQRQERVRVLVIGTYRPTDLESGHPLKKIKHELQIRQKCEEISVQLLNEQEVTTYLAKRFPDHAVSTELASVIHRRTEGNALFMVNLVNALADQGLILEKEGKWEIKDGSKGLGIPESLRGVIEQKFEHLGVEERQVLEAASVGGGEFTAVAIAAAIGRETLDVEERCADLVRYSQFIREREPRQWPDGTVTACYGFVHSLYQEVLYDRLTPGKRAQLHLYIGQRLEQAYGERSREIATELALHFEQGRDDHRALLYLQQAADTATQRCAYQEAVAYLMRGLQLLRHIPVTSEHVQQELRMQTSLGMSLMATKGYAAPEAKQAYDRAYALCQQVGENSHLFPVLRGLVTFYSARADYQTTRALGERYLTLAHREHDPLLLLGAHLGLGAVLFSLGDFVQARTHLEQGVALYDPQQHSSSVLLYGYNLGVACYARLATVLWLLGYPEQALEKSQQALALAREQPHFFSVAYALSFATECARLRRDVQATQAQAETTLQLSTAQGFSLWEAGARCFLGWALTEQGQMEEGIAQLQQGITAWQATGAAIGVPSWLVQLAEAYEKVGQHEAGLTVLAEALAVVNKNGERWWEAELYRLRGELTLAQSIVQGPVSEVSKPQQEAEACFLKAIEIAQRQQAKSLELRAVMSLVRLRQSQTSEYGSRNTQHESRTRLAEAHLMLFEIYHWFTEGFDTKDLQEAKVLLEELSH